ncbi:MAG TPA: ABC transporter ATP-binding protein [Myxococcales bacterium]|nr:ABC transporter ATP-binding protein [Myxococcales bacterium]
MPVLRGVSLSVAPGEMVTLVGANGAGKSTLLKCIAGLLRAASGAIELDGASLAGRPAHDVVRAGVALVPEGRRLFGRLSVDDNLLLGAYARSERERRAALPRVRELFPVLADRANQLAGTLSGGEQQMLAMARALMGRPRFLLLDEPSLGIAPRVVPRIYQTLAQIHRQGLGILLVEQNVRLALSHASRAYVLQTGSIVLSGAREELLRSDLVRQAFLGL